MSIENREKKHETIAPYLDIFSKIDNNYKVCNYSLKVNP